MPFEIHRTFFYISLSKPLNPKKFVKTFAPIKFYQSILGLAHLEPNRFRARLRCDFSICRNLFEVSLNPKKICGDFCTNLESQFIIYFCAPLIGAQLMFLSSIRHGLSFF